MPLQEINVYTVIFHEARVLALERPNGLWEFAGGSIDWGETPEQAAVRESKEETGLAVENLRLLGTTSATYKKDGKNKHAIYIVYRADASTYTVALSSEHKNHHWLEIPKLRSLKWGLNAEPVLAMLKE